MSMITLPFGRHKNTPLTSVPSDYLTWALSTCKLSSGVRAALETELRVRGGTVPPPPKSIMRKNAEKDPKYTPYCLRCPGLIRMRLTPAPFFWRCFVCGAEHDERTEAEREEQEQ